MLLRLFLHKVPKRSLFSFGVFFIRRFDECMRRVYYGFGDSVFGERRVSTLTEFGDVLCVLVRVSESRGSESVDKYNALTIRIFL